MTVIYFSIVNHNNKKSSFHVSPANPSIIGRSVNSQVQIEDPLCSGRHLEISFENNILLVKDLNSKNGVYYAGNRVEQTQIKGSDIITIGNSTIQIDLQKTSSDLILDLERNFNSQNTKNFLQLESSSTTQTAIKINSNDKFVPSNSSRKGHRQILTPTHYFQTYSANFLDVVIFILFFPYLTWHLLLDNSLLKVFADSWSLPSDILIKLISLLLGGFLYYIIKKILKKSFGKVLLDLIAFNHKP